MAWSWLHGHLDLIGANPDSSDLSPYNKKMFAYWPPLPAILMLPIVAITGPDLFPQRLFCMIIGAFNTGFCLLLFFQLAKFFDLKVNPLFSLITAFFYAFGSSNIIFSISGSHWGVGQLVAATMAFVGLYFGFDKKPLWKLRSSFLSMVFFSLSFLSRSHMVLSIPLWIYLSILKNRHENNKKENIAYCLRWLILFTPVFLSVLTLLIYNKARFDDYFETGLTYHNMNSIFRSDFNQYGYFHYHFLLKNIYFTLLRPIFFNIIDGFDRYLGFGLFYQSPFLIFCFAKNNFHQLNYLKKIVWLSISFTICPILACMGTGWLQFGARYLFDVVPYLLILVFLNRFNAKSSLFYWLGLLSIVINFYGLTY